ncbi:MAG: CapA family protein [Clostridia bacterium]|nr:CapA family protein [Clostridia bacterium]
MKNKSTIFVIVFSVIMIAVVIAAAINKKSDNVVPVVSGNIKEVSQTTKSKETTVTVGSVGDILLHMPINRSCYNEQTKTYDYNDIFKYVNKYYSKFDCMVADLEQPIAGKKFGYSGFPLFNAPSEIVDALKDNGVDLLLTANNHCYDQGKEGFQNTMNTLQKKGVKFIGSREENIKPYIIMNLDGINIGMINYTYETQPLSDTKYINGIPMDKSITHLLNSFDYNKLDDFYSGFQTNMDNMYKDGADVIVAYMHWGEEYNLGHTDYQQRIAQKLCDMGVDAIVGGHTHCIEPTDLISSEVSGKQTPIIYSTGNQLSNQRKETLNKFSSDKPYFEDGVIYELSFSRKADGSVILSNVSYTATWCNLFGSKYRIIPLDEKGNYKTEFSSLGRTQEMSNSLKRTKGLLDKGIKKFKKEYKQIDLRKKSA